VPEEHSAPVAGLVDPHSSTLPNPWFIAKLAKNWPIRPKL
jgi:hypothetical protein